MIESALPEDRSQEQTPTVLLPEPNFLPPPPPQSPGSETVLTMASAEGRRTPQDESRFKEIKDTAMGSARASYLMKEAKGALSGEARKNFMRAYYYTICSQMRRLDPNLKLMIQAYESEEIQKIAAEGGSSHGGKTKNGRTHGGWFLELPRQRNGIIPIGSTNGGAARTGCELPQFVTLRDKRRAG